MTDVRDEETTANDEENRLPWLEAVDEDDEPEGPSAAKLIAFVVIGLVAIGLIVGGIFWLGNRSEGGTGGPELIAAPKGGPDLMGVASETGTLDPGKSADLIAVDGDPLTDPTAVQHVGYVMVRGKPVPMQ